MGATLNVMLGGATLLGILASGTTAHAYLSTLTVHKCLAGKVKVEGKGAAAYTKCHGKDAAKPDPVKLSSCLGKASAKITNGFAKLDTKYPACPGGTGNGPARDSDTASFAATIDASVGSALGKCDAAKQQCVGKYTAAIMGCYSKAANKTGVVDNAPGGCTAKVALKLADGVKGCLDKAAASGGCSNAGSQQGTLQPAADSYIQASAS